MSKKIKNYISPIDQALQAFDQSHPPSLSQQKEMDKHQSVFEQRDRAGLVTQAATTDHIWEDF